MEIYSYNGDDFKAVMSFEDWKIGFLRCSDRFSRLSVWERHNETDEAFVLLEGEATLYVEDKTYEMEKCILYNVQKGEWHHIVVSPDATVMVVENSNTSQDNTDIKEVE